jgi:RNA polymerase sigma-70 factor (ECF subfamily)
MQLERVHPESQLMDKELMEAIDNTVDRLPDRCKMVFRLVKEDNLSYKQAAEVLNISPKTVQAQMVIALKRIKDALKACEFL